MKFQAVVKQATSHLLRSEKARTYVSSAGREYTLDIEKDEDGNLVVTTWGFDHEIIAVPKERVDVIRLKIRIQLIRTLSGVDKVALRYYLDILRREARE